MKKLLFILLLGLAACRPTQNSDPTPTPTQPTNYADQVATYMQAQADARGFTGAVLVAKNGQVLYQNAFGYANYDTKAPLTLNSMFELASVSKQFTAMSILLLKEQGKLSLSDTLRKFFPELPYTGITIQQLLTHTSGLPDYIRLMETKWNHKKVAFNADMIQLLAEEKPPVFFRPGRQYLYSNTGYELLASIVEKVSGQPFAQFASQNIFKPLGMDRSRIYNTRRSANEVIPDYAYGYVYSSRLDRYVLPDGEPGLEAVYYLDGTAGAKSVNSTVGDLLKWDRALKNHTLLSEATQREMLSGQVSINADNGQAYGYGVGVNNTARGQAFAHSGGWIGYTTYLVRYVANDVTIIMLSNNESDSPQLSETLADILFDKAVVLPKVRGNIIVDEKILDTYVGNYQLTPNLILNITKEGGRLISQATGQNKFALFADTETKFYPKEFEAEIEFIKDSSGKVTKLILTQNGQKTEAKKIS